jgi:flagellar protein FlaF
VLADDCANPENGLPAPLRASIISLAMWVSRHTSAVIRRREDFEPLIQVNRIIMQGLAPGAVSATTAAA